jgi:serine/threonine protein kinase
MSKFDDSAPQLPSHAPGKDMFNALPRGYRLQEYALEGVLGAGGFGITYLAHDHNLDCKVAIKEYLPADQAGRNADEHLQPNTPEAAETYRWGLTRFLDEARALATFRHPHIVRVSRFFEANSTAYMVMEFVSGEPLGHWIRRNRPVDEAAMLRIIRPVLDGLSVMHASGFVHRDIKPGNIHMRSDYDPVLLDFGAARRVLSQDNRELTAIVTPGYAALEQYHTHGNQGPWTDIYSLAALMYGIITGRRPIEAPARARNDPLPKAMDVGDRKLYSDELLRAIDWGLTPEEEKRPQSAQIFAQALPDPSTARTLTPEERAEQTKLLQESEPDPPSELEDPTLISQIESALAGHIGPMAPFLVRRIAKNHRTIESLRSALASEIEDEKSRLNFLARTDSLRKNYTTAPHPISRPASAPVASKPASAPAAAAAAAFDPAFLARVEVELAQHLGPLARVLVKKSSAKARDRAELFLLLSDNIADPEQRRAFVRKSVAAFKDKS